MTIRAMLRGRALLAFLLGLLVPALLYAVLPRHPDLTGFSPAAVARTETDMWRRYYEKNYLPLVWDLYSLGRQQYGFSPWQSAQLALNAGVAAARFQPAGAAHHPETALPALTRYYTVLLLAAPARFDVAQAARLELSWWEARRHAVAPANYALTIAQGAALVYGIDNAAMRQAAQHRAAAMAYRDAQGRAMRPADWQWIEAELGAAYRLLKQAALDKAPAKAASTRM
jgi:hypothetical protein